MTNEMIENFLNKHAEKKQLVNIHFKQRQTIKGLFIHTKDFDELKTKNLWRIVADARCTEYGRTRDESLARIFNGVEFTRLTADN